MYYFLNTIEQKSKAVFFIFHNIFFFFCPHFVLEILLIVLSTEMNKRNKSNFVSDAKVVCLGLRILEQGLILQIERYGETQFI